MKMTVWSMVRWDRYGDSIIVFASESEARAALATFVTENWAYRMGDKPMPLDSEDAARVYFEAQEDESAFLEPHEIRVGITAAAFATFFQTAWRPFQKIMEFARHRSLSEA